MKKVLWVGDGVTPTGFSTVNHNIIKHLNKEKFEVHHIAVNYWGDPHEYEHYIYPAATPRLLQVGDVMGFGRLEEFVDADIDCIFILNDIWLIARYLEVIKEVWSKAKKDIPKIIIYYPVDGAGYGVEWFKDFDIVSKTVVYTQFGADVTLAAMPGLDLKIIPHGAADKNSFYKIPKTLREIKTQAYPTRPDLHEDSFIVLNANRNQPRKRLDISLRGFAIFAQDKPNNVMYYHHGGIKDAGWHIIDLMHRLEKEMGTNLQKRIVLTNAEMTNQSIPMEKLNEIYNSTDVGLNTSLGEGWGLIQTEHASIGKPQVVGDHSACAELFHDVGLLIPVVQTVRDTAHLTKRCYVSAEGVAEQLEKLYQDRDLYRELSEKSFEKFNRPEYDWKNIAEQWQDLFETVCQ